MSVEIHANHSQVVRVEAAAGAKTQRTHHRGPMRPEIQIVASVAPVDPVLAIWELGGQIIPHSCQRHREIAKLLPQSIDQTIVVGAARRPYYIVFPIDPQNSRAIMGATQELHSGFAQMWQRSVPKVRRISAFTKVWAIN